MAGKKRRRGIFHAISDMNPERWLREGPMNREKKHGTVGIRRIENSVHIDIQARIIEDVV